MFWNWWWWWPNSVNIMKVTELYNLSGRSTWCTHHHYFKIVTKTWIKDLNTYLSCSAFKIFSFYSFNIMICLGVDVLEFILLRICSDVWTCRLVFSIKFGCFGSSFLQRYFLSLSLYTFCLELPLCACWNAWSYLKEIWGSVHFPSFFFS